MVAVRASKRIRVSTYLLGWIGAGMTACALAVLPWTAQPVPNVALVLPTIILSASVADFVTFILLVSAYVQARRLAIGFLAALYMGASLLAGALLVTLPPGPAQPPIVSVGPQVAAWIYLSWHALFPVGAIVYALLRRRPGEVEARRMVRMLIAMTSLCTLTVVVVLVALNALQALLPCSSAERTSPRIAQAVSVRPF
jgi:hypothetical protein